MGGYFVSLDESNFLFQLVVCWHIEKIAISLSLLLLLNLVVRYYYYQMVWLKKVGRRQKSSRHGMCLLLVSSIMLFVIHTLVLWVRIVSVSTRLRHAGQKECPLKLDPAVLLQGRRKVGRITQTNQLRELKWEMNCGSFSVCNQFTLYNRL